MAQMMVRLTAKRATRVKFVRRTSAAVEVPDFSHRDGDA